MNQSTASYYQPNQMSAVIDPYYTKGDVFKRDPRYYDQLINRRNRSPLKPGDSSGFNTNTIRPNPGSSLSGPIITDSYVTPPNNPNTQIIVTPPSPPPTNIISQPIQDGDELRRLRQQHMALTTQLQKLTYGGQFGTGDTVIKKGHYTASKTQNAAIRDQQLKIRSLQDTLRLNNQKLIKYQKASSQLEIRMQNIQSIDKQIYKQLKSASTRDKELLERANQALLRGQPKDNVLRILEQIVIS